MKTKRELFEAGIEHVNKWCAANKVVPPRVVECEDPENFGTCAYYRDGEIFISVRKCAAPGVAGRAWSWPGYVVDRTPYGVLAHELGHHVDRQHGPAGGVLSHLWRPLDAAPLTSYCPNDNEWFAELFRLFVTNPDLFRRVRPKIANMFFREWPWVVELRMWPSLLPPRHISAAANKIAAAIRASA